MRTVAVDVADITAVIDIIRELNGGYSTGDSPYYLYVGHEDSKYVRLKYHSYWFI